MRLKSLFSAIICLVSLLAISCNSKFSQNVQVNNESSNPAVNPPPPQAPAQPVENREIEATSDESDKLYSKTNPNLNIAAKETVSILIKVKESKTINIGRLKIEISAEAFDKPVNVTIKTFSPDLDRSKELLDGQTNVTSYSISIEDENGNLIPVNSVLQEIITKILLDRSITSEDSIFVEVTNDEYSAIDAKISSSVSPSASESSETFSVSTSAPVVSFEFALLELAEFCSDSVT